MSPRAVAGPTRYTARVTPRGNRECLQKIAASLTERDLRFLDFLFEHKVLTTDQICEMFFNSRPRTRDRLLRLLELGLIRRTRPQKRPGSLPYHYVLDILGALVVSELRGIELSELGFRLDRRLGIIEGSRLRHLRDINGFLSRLEFACRHSDGQYRLVRAWSEDRCRSRWNDNVTPDALVELEGPDASISSFLELDRATENLDRLTQKLGRYRLIAGAPSAPKALLFSFPSTARETSAREALYNCGLVVATTTLDRHLADPLGAVWRPLRADYRVRLIDLASTDNGGTR